MSEPVLRVAYLASAYPYPSHVFIEREIAGIRALGVEVTTFSIRRIPDEMMLSESMRAEQGRTSSLLERPREVLASNARLARRHPGVAWSGLITALRSGERAVKPRVWQVFYLAEAIRLRELMVAAGLRHIHVHLANNAADVARLVVKLGEELDGMAAGWRWTLSMHGPTEFEAVQRYDLGAKVRSASAVACISDFTRSQLMRQVDPEEWDKLSVVRMSVDLTRYPPRTDWSLRGERMRILSVGRLVPEKGAPVLLDALAALRELGVDAQVRFVGAGDLQQTLLRRVTELGLSDQVELVGAIGQDQLPEQYAWADVFCLPSFQEGLPVVLMEAMSSALPVVTTPIAGVPELVESGATGLLVAPGRDDLLADALQRLQGSVELRGTLARKGRQRVEAGYDTAVTSHDQLEFLLRAQGK